MDVCYIFDPGSFLFIYLKKGWSKADIREVDEWMWTMKWANVPKNEIWQVGNVPKNEIWQACQQWGPHFATKKVMVDSMELPKIWRFCSANSCITHSMINVKCVTGTTLYLETSSSPLFHTQPRRDTSEIWVNYQHENYN
jgi:hypothetical protein